MIVDKFLNQLKDINGKILILCSGGLDSAATTKLLVKRYGPEKIEILNINYGQLQGHLEEECTKKISKLNGIKHHIIDIKSVFGPIYKGISSHLDSDMIFEKSTMDAPGRTLIWFSYAAAFCFANKINTIATGVCVLGDMDPLPGSSPEFYPTNLFVNQSFMNPFQEILSAHYLGDNKINIINPIIHIKKWQIIQMIYELDGNVDYFKNTISCYNPSPDGISCGECPTCLGRMKGFIKAGYEDPIPYIKYLPKNEILSSPISVILH